MKSFDEIEKFTKGAVENTAPKTFSGNKNPGSNMLFAANSSLLLCYLMDINKTKGANEYGKEENL